MYRNQKGFTLYELFIVLVGLFGIVGWVWNIVRIVGMLDGGITAGFVFRCVGVLVAPLGAVIGYIPF